MPVALMYLVLDKIGITIVKLKKSKCSRCVRYVSPRQRVSPATSRSALAPTYCISFACVKNGSVINGYRNLYNEKY